MASVTVYIKGNCPSIPATALRLKKEPGVLELIFHAVNREAVRQSRLRELSVRQQFVTIDR